MKCKKCKKREAKSKGFCVSCYHKNYRKNNEGEIKKYREEKYKRNVVEIKEDQKHQRNRIRFGGNRYLALERDNYQCQHCGMSREQHFILFNKSLTVDHIDKNGINSKEKNNDLDNLMTLCFRCHARKDKILVMREKYGELMNQDESKWKYPKIRELVKKEAKESKVYLWKAQRTIARRLNIKEGTVNHKYYEKKVLIPGESRKSDDSRTGGKE